MEKRKVFIVITGAVILCLLVGVAVWRLVIHNKADTSEIAPPETFENGTIDEDGGYIETVGYGDGRKIEIQSYPIAAEVEYHGTLYNVYKKDSSVFYYNTEEDTLAYGYNTTLTDGALYVYPAPGTPIDITEIEGCFKNVWLRDDRILAGMLGWLESNAVLELRARTATFAEWVYRYPNGKYCRMLVNEKYIIFSDLLFDFVFEIKTY